MKLVTQNKKAYHDYFIEAVYECGIVLTGTEVKAIRLGKVNINDGYIQIKNHEAFIINMHIAKYTQGNLFNHDERRTRKLLLHHREIVKLMQKIKLEGYTLIPLKLYFKNALAKIEIGLAKGKKLHDKRQSLKEADMKRRIEKALRLS